MVLLIWQEPGCSTAVCTKYRRRHTEAQVHGLVAVLPTVQQRLARHRGEALSVYIAVPLELACTRVVWITIWFTAKGEAHWQRQKKAYRGPGPRETASCPGEYQAGP